MIFRLFALPFFFVLLSLAACAPQPYAGGGGGRTALSLKVPPNLTTYEPTTKAVDYIVVQKSDRILTLWKQGRVVKTYPILAMGQSPVGAKLREGDEKTPEGIYYINEKHPSPNFQKFLEISYPNDSDKKNAAAQNANPGGHVGIHGDRGGFEGFMERLKKDWTDGCLAMRNADIEEIYAAVDVGTPIMITP